MTIYAHNNLFIQNKYYNWYFALIAKARTKVYDDYSEVHHIIPDCLGGTDDPDNLVRLSYQEHFLCHWMLIKFVNTPEAEAKMIRSLLCMTWSSNNHKRIVSSWQFDVVKRAAKDNMRGENNPVYGKTRHNNGIEEIMLSVDEEIPEGFVLGRLPFSEETRRKMRGKKYYNNGIKEIKLSDDKEVPEGFVPGGLPTTEKTKLKMRGINHPCYGKKHYNNGIKGITISHDEEVPEGFVPGILSNRLPMSDENKSKLSDINRGKKHYNNGIKCIRLSVGEEIPEGFVPGRLPTSEESKLKMSGANHPCYGKKHYNNGINNRMLSDDEEVPEGFVPGRLSFSEETRRKMSDNMRGKKRYNNGTNEMRLSDGEEVPEGYIPGGLPISEETRRKMSTSGGKGLGKKWYNNGINEILLSADQAIPDDFVRGRLYKS